MRYGKSNRVIVEAVTRARAGERTVIACGTEAECGRVREAIAKTLTPEQRKLVTVSGPRAKLEGRLGV